jgi:hypothetical protein
VPHAEQDTAKAVVDHVRTVRAGALEHVSKPAPEVDRERVDGLAVDPIVERHQPPEPRRAQAVREHRPGTPLWPAPWTRTTRVENAHARSCRLKRAESSHHPTEAPRLVKSAARLAVQRRAERSYRAQHVPALRMLPPTSPSRFGPRRGTPADRRGSRIQPCPPRRAQPHGTGSRSPPWRPLRIALHLNVGRVEQSSDKHDDFEHGVLRGGCAYGLPGCVRGEITRSGVSAGHDGGSPEAIPALRLNARSVLLPNS